VEPGGELSRVDLPRGALAPFEVFVGGVPQQPGVDYDVVERTIVFRRSLAKEGRLGFWRWFSMFLGVAGTYRKNELVDIVYTVGGRREVATLEPVDVQPAG
jgi:hypothetical protein